MTKFDKFFDSLDGKEVTALNGDLGYVVTLGDLIDNGGRDEFFRIVRSEKNGLKVSRDVYRGLEYDREDKAWWADTYTGICGYAIGLTRSTRIFIGFTF